MPSRKSQKQVVQESDIAMSTKPEVEVDVEMDSDSNDAQNDTIVEQSVVKSKPRKSVVDKIDYVINLVNQESSTSLIVKNLQSIRKVLDGAHIKSLKKSRQPNAYNLFMSEEMEKLKDSTMPATAKFKHCINLWNERKLSNIATEVTVGEC